MSRWTPHLGICKNPPNLENQAVSWHLVTLHSINFSDVFPNNSNPYDKEYNLRITLGVGGRDFDNQDVTLPDVASWVTPSIRIDYFKVYDFKNGINLGEELKFEPRHSSLWAD